MNNKQITTALISVYHKQELNEIIKELYRLGVEIISTGGTYKYIIDKGIPVIKVENITDYPSIFGGRVKTLHPKIFGGILMRTSTDTEEANKFNINPIDLVIVDLYPFEEVVATGAKHEEIIEKIDIGGISLIRAAAKNYEDVLVISHRNQYPQLLEILKNGGQTTIEQRKDFAAQAFMISSHYDTKIYHYLNAQPLRSLKISEINNYPLRYGENPHQQAAFFGNLGETFTQLHGKQLSYNNLLDADAAVSLISEFDETTVAIIKHTNPCGLASDKNLTQAWKKALAGDPESAFGGIIITNSQVDKATAEEINKLFFEIIIAPAYEKEALDILKQKKNRRILVLNKYPDTPYQIRSAFNGYLYQEKDFKNETQEDLQFVTNNKPDERQIQDLLFANKIVKHLKSNAIAIVKDKQLIGAGMGQPSRVDALRQAIAKAHRFGFDLNDAVMASDAFFPFADSVEIAYKEGITAVIQPGGSIRDQDSIDFCNTHNIAMVFTGIRHFKH